MKQQLTSLDSALTADNAQAPAFSMADLMAQFEMPSAPKRNSIVTGEVVAAVKGGFLVSLGMKSDSLVRDAEPGELEIGKSYQFYVCDETDNEGEGELSYRRAAAWTRLAGLVTSQNIVMAQVHRDSKRAVARSKSDRIGGLIAYIDGLRCFIPRSETQQHGRLEDLAGQEIPVVVLSADPAKGRGGEIVLSQSRALTQIRQARLAELSLGDVLEGTVVKVIEAGVLVDVGELTGLVGRSEVGGNRNADHSGAVKAGQKVTVKVTSINHAKGQVSLSIRGARQDSFLRSLKEGDVVTGTVARFEPYGAFVCIGDCIDGLLHKEDYGFVAGNRRENLTVGQVIEVEVATLDVEKSRIGLSRKKLASK